MSVERTPIEFAFVGSMRMMAGVCELLHLHAVALCKGERTEDLVLGVTEVTLKEHLRRDEPCSEAEVLFADVNLYFDVQ